ncbi:cation:dicarboxylase symporter family transporter [Lentisphaera profundi]|uniref:Cation:dicarboxylase symporter family transporter n=1 Tax=Lentisphaera profundi TaxID=1658616 RepID=A0ABY7VNW7_9BACT|nr:cation:dicarboxylase symporter family transporter [Lentisphaera profundi]WDE95838.1 cation:dicarboxylase symporter family transporter [Lentisphaera profundi]
MKKERKKMSLSSKILIGLGLGVVVGLFFGEKCAWMSHVGYAFIKIMQMTILPYITISMIKGLGSLSLDQAKNLAIRGGVVVIALWALAIALLLCVPLVFPELKNAHFFQASSVTMPAAVNYYDLYIPSNPFHSLAISAVPAVVIFSMALGVALITIEPKKHLMNNLVTLNDAISKITKKLVSLSPVGVFAITANAAGTISPDELQRLQVFIITYVVSCLLLTFVILPALISAITGYKYKDILMCIKDPLIAAFTLNNLFIVLPMLAESSKKIMEMNGRLNDTNEELADIIIPISFNFPNLAKVMSLLFVLFAGWFVNSEVPITSYPSFAISGLLSSFGAKSLTIPFLLNSYEIPEDMYQLFMLAGIVTGRFGILLASVHLVSLTLISIRFMTEGFKITPMQLFKANIPALLMTLLAFVGMKFYFAATIKNVEDKREVLSRLKVVNKVDHKVYTEIPDLEKNTTKDLKTRVMERGIIRIGYRKSNLPFTYLNNAGEVQGFDIQYAHELARNMNCKIAFIPFERDNMAALLADGTIDIATSGLPFSPSLLNEVRFSEPVMTVNLALITKDHMKKELSSKENRLNNVYKIAVLDDNPFVEIIKERAPHLKLEFINSDKEYFTEKNDFDALLISAEAGSAWTLYHPGYSVVIPRPSVFRYGLAAAVAERDADFLSYLNQWLKVKEINGFEEKNYDYWILGKGAEIAKKRWCIGSDVLKLW